MKNLLQWAVALTAAIALAACSNVPISTPTLDQARASYAQANSDPQVAQYAPLEFRQASDALDRANAASAKRDTLNNIDKLAYIAQQKIDTAREVARAKAAQAQAQAAARERDAVRLEQRTAEAERAKADAANANAQAAAAQSQAAQAQAEASAADQAARDAQARSAQFETLIAELHAQRTPRGLVITLPDVLFDTDQTRLKPDGLETARKLADLLASNPQRTVMVEGFTDSTGTLAHNQELSERRATAVRDTLVSMGVGRDRVAMRGYGPRFPVASNRTASDRQLNRRVEIVLSDESGRIPPR